MGKPESGRRAAVNKEDRGWYPHSTDPAPWDFGAFGRRLADVLAAAVRKVGVKHKRKPG
jgi:hypothetical protein